MKLDYFEHSAISNSKLSTFIYDPSYFHKLYIEKSITEKKESSSLELGTLVHCLLLEPETFTEKYRVSDLKDSDLPTGMMLEFVKALASQDLFDELAIDYAYIKSGYKISKEKVLENYNKVDSYKEYYKELKDERIIISKGLYNQAVELAKIASDNKQWNYLIDSTWTNLHELEIYFESEPLNECSVVNLKAKLDKLCYKLNEKTKSISLKYFDFKTESQKPIHKYNESFIFWRTYRQMAFYKDAIYHWAYETFPDYTIESLKMYVVPIDVVRNKSFIFEVGQSYLDMGKDEIENALNDLNWHITMNNWEHPRHLYKENVPVLECIFPSILSSSLIEKING